MTRKEEACVDLIASLLLTGAGLFFLCNMHEYIDEGLPAVVSPLVFPKFIVVIILLFSVAFLCGSIIAACRIRRDRAAMDSRIAAYNEADEEEEEHGRGFYIYIAILIVYYLTFDSLGFLVSTPPVMLAIAWLLGGRRPVLAFASFILFCIVVEQVFYRAMKMALPAGILPF